MPELAFALIDDAVRGDRRAARGLVDLLAPVVHYRVARALLCRRGVGRDVRREAEDITQSVFLSLFGDAAAALRCWHPGRGASLNDYVGLLVEREVVAILVHPRRRDLAEGTLSEADRAALDALAERSPAAREALDAYRPLDEEARERITEGILAQLAGAHEDSAPPSSQTRPLRVRDGSGRARHGAPAAADEPEAAAAAVDSLGGTSVAPMLDGPAPWGREDDDEQPASGPRAVPPPEASWPRDHAPAEAPAPADGADRPASPPAQPAAARDAARPAAAPAGWRSRTRPYATAAAWAAGALLLSFLALRPAPFAPGAAPLPAYSLAAPGGDPGQAPPLADERRLAPGERLELTLRPASPVSVPLAVDAYLLRGGEAQRWDVAVQIDDDGAVRVAGTREELFRDRPDGAWEAVFAVGRAEARAATPEAIAAALREGGPGEAAGYRLIPLRVVLAPAR